MPIILIFREVFDKAATSLECGSLLPPLFKLLNISNLINNPRRKQACALQGNSVLQNMMA
jgi:hypothetical protein